MAYRFKLTETFDHGVRRIGLQQLDRIIAELETLEDADRAVHTTRKGLKRLRALLRLAKPGLDSNVYRTENRNFRDIGRMLARARDRLVLAQTLERLEALAEGKARLAFKAAGKHLAASKGGAPAAVEDRAIQRALGALKAARKRFDTLAIHAKGFEAAFDGLKLGYAHAVKTFKAACESGEAEDIHEWRKRVQHHFRHLALMWEASPVAFDARIEAARRLALALGEDHDIAMVLAAVGDCGALTVGAAHRRAIEDFAAARRAALWADAQAAGRALFSDKPRIFREKVKGQWTSARDDAAKVKPEA